MNSFIQMHKEIQFTIINYKLFNLRADGRNKHALSISTEILNIQRNRVGDVVCMKFYVGGGRG